MYLLGFRTALTRTFPKLLCTSARRISVSAQQNLLAKQAVELDRMQQEKCDLELSLEVAQANDFRDPKVAQRDAELRTKRVFETGAVHWEKLEQVALAGQFIWAWRSGDYNGHGQDPKSGPTTSYELYSPSVWKTIEAGYLAWIVTGRSNPFRFVEVDVGGQNCFYHYETVDFHHMEQRPSGHGHLSTPPPWAPRSLQRLAISQLSEVQKVDHAQRCRRAIAEKDEAIGKKWQATQQAFPLRLMLNVAPDQGDIENTLFTRPGKLDMAGATAYSEDDVLSLISQLDK